MFIIAEFGSSPSSYNWNLEPWCGAAHLVGADAVKVQLWHTDHFPPDEQASKRSLEFPRQRLGEFVELAHRHSLRVGASVFDLDAVRLVSEHCDFVKLAAREQYNSELIDFVMSVPMPMLGYRSISSFDAYRASTMMIALFAIQRYPSPMLSALSALVCAALWFRSRGIGWGWSSHTSGVLDCVLAARLGALAIEKHLALSLRDIEAGHSLLPPDFSRMVRGVRHAHQH